MDTRPSFSFEFFPPRDAAQSRRFWRTFGALESLAPTHVSLTWGALGSDERVSLETLALLARDTAVPITAHLCCAGRTPETLRETLDAIEAAGVRRVLALRGDAVPDDASARGAFRHAAELVALIASERPHLDVSVAAYPETHPEAPDADTDLRYLAEKLSLGARRAVTQFFFEPAPFLRWRDRARAIGVDQPLVPGILPVHDIDAVARFAAKCGATVPRRLSERFARATDERDRERIAIEECVTLCGTLAREGVDAFHLYTLNRSALSRAVVEALGGSGGVRVAA